MGDELSGRAAGPNGLASRERLKPPWPRDGSPLLAVPFDHRTLRNLRAEVQAFAVRAQLPHDRIGDLVLAAHELAANAVQHGAGSGVLRAWHTAGVVRCRVDDGDFPVLAKYQANHGGTGTAVAPHADDGALVTSLRCEPGHGLWVVRQVTDELQSWSGPHGTSVTFTVGGGRS